MLLVATINVFVRVRTTKIKSEQGLKNSDFNNYHTRLEQALSQEIAISLTNFIAIALECVNKPLISQLHSYDARYYLKGKVKVICRLKIDPGKGDAAEITLLLVYYYLCNRYVLNTQ